MLFSNDQPKTSFTAVRFPFVARRVSRHKVDVWARSPGRGKVKIISTGHDYRQVVAKLPAKPDRVVHERLQLRGATHLTAKLRHQKSMRLRIPRRKPHPG